MDRSRRIRPLAIAITVLLLAGLALITVPPRVSAGTAIVFSEGCAQAGTQSIGGQNNSDVHLYDDEMQADLVVNLSANGFVSLTLSFYYYSHTESGGGDWIQAWYEAGGT